MTATPILLDLRFDAIFLHHRSVQELRDIYLRCAKFLLAVNPNLTMERINEVSERSYNERRMYEQPKSVFMVSGLLSRVLDKADYRVTYTSPETEMWDPMASTMTSHTDHEKWFELVSEMLGDSKAKFRKMMKEWDSMKPTAIRYPLRKA